MAELAFLGLVANIFQFVEAGIKIASTARDVHQGSVSLNLQTREIRLLLDDVRQTSTAVSKLPRGTLSGDELVICDYSEECYAIATDLETIAAKLAKREGAKSRTLDSVRIAYHSVTKKNEIQDLLTRLSRVDERLRTRLDKVLHREAGLENEDRWSSVMAAIERLDLKAESMDISHGNLLETAAQNLRTQLNTEALMSGLVQLFANEIQSMQYYQNQLESLLFQDIQQRYSDINPAHKATFQWTFDRAHAGFSQWLESGSGYFWIHGLAGSGKSTLMKYLYDHGTSEALLRKWAGKKRLVTAHFFFWALGTKMQRSQLGLLQSLLFQLVRADLSLAATVFSARRYREPWTIDELREAFQLVSARAEEHTRFCFFIDGLDEYEGNETDIISTVAELLNSSNIKICLSSRPWNRFREAYADCPGLTLEYLTKTDIFEYIKSELLSNRSFHRSVDEDPRCANIIAQIASQARGVFLWVFLVTRNLLRDIQSREPFEHLQQRVNELPPSLEDYFQRIFDRIDAIYRQQTARLFLVALYLEERDEDPLPLMAYNCLEVELRDPSYAAKQRLLARDPDWIQHLPENVAESQRIAIIRLDDRCKDLLQPRRNETFHPASIHYFHISLLHRTVRDFFRDNFYGALKEKAGGDFSPEGSIAKCLLWLYKTYPIKFFFAPSIKGIVDLPDGMRAMVPASKLHEDHKMSLVLYRFWSHVMHHAPLMDDEVIESFFDTMVIHCGQSWARLIVPPQLSRYFIPYPADLMLTPWASYLNLDGYLRHNWKAGKAAGGFFDYEVLTLLLALEPRCLQALPPPSAASAATPGPKRQNNYTGSVVVADGEQQPPPGGIIAISTREQTTPVPIRPATVQALLELGCDPRDQKLGLLFLARFQKARWDSQTIVGLTRVGGKADVYVSNRNVFAVARLLFEHGLSVPLGPDEECGLCKANFASVFRPLFGADGVAELAEIRRQLQGQVSWARRFSRAFGMFRA
ncbi:hypothetical protein PGQ11_003967 [Apiospora arundinis]|uniref:NACHT domain-containing protein n=1 Tax=Apiospora arundinis TaxID=335852 RepID=A0ABR2J6N4_9PEZI